MKMTDYNDGKWHGWNGGECPVHPKTIVAAIAANGNMAADSFSPSFIERQAETITWTKDKGAVRAAIVAFRVVKAYQEPQEPREWWLAKCGGYTHPHERRAAADIYASANRDVEIIHVREVQP